MPTQFRWNYPISSDEFVCFCFCFFIDFVCKKQAENSFSRELILCVFRKQQRCTNSDKPSVYRFIVNNLIDRGLTKIPKWRNPLLDYSSWPFPSAPSWRIQVSYSLNRNSLDLRLIFTEISIPFNSSNNLSEDAQRLRFSLSHCGCVTEWLLKERKFRRNDWFDWILEGTRFSGWKLNEIRRKSWTSRFNSLKTMQNSSQNRFEWCHCLIPHSLSFGSGVLLITNFSPSTDRSVCRILRIKLISGGTAVCGLTFSLTITTKKCEFEKLNKIRLSHLLLSSISSSQLSAGSKCDDMTILKSVLSRNWHPTKP